MWDGKEILKADQFLKKTKYYAACLFMFKSGKTIISQYNFQDINNAIKKIETLNQKLLSDIKIRKKKI